MFIEAQGTPDGIPTSIVEKKVEELKATGGVKEERGSLAKATETETDWKHRYQSLTGGNDSHVRVACRTKSFQLQLHCKL